MPEDEIAHLFMVAKTISNAVLRSLGVQGTNIIVQNGIVAGQKAQHFMVHIIPRKEKDDLNFEIPQKEMPEEELESIRKKLEAKLGEVKGTKKPKLNIQELIKPKIPIIEAEFKEEKKETKTKKEKKTNSINPPKKGSKNKKGKENAGLDDIARLIGVK